MYSFHDRMLLYAKKQTNSSNDPFCRLLLCLEVEGPHIGGSTHASLVHWALVHVLSVLFIHRGIALMKRVSSFSRDSWMRLV